MSDQSVSFAIIYLLMPVMVLVSLVAVASSIRTMLARAQLEAVKDSLRLDIDLLEAKPGQVIVFTVPDEATRSQVMHLRDVVKLMIPDGVKAIIMKSDATISVIDSFPVVQSQPKE